MAIKKIPCGGFSYDDSTVEFVDGVMKAKGAGGDSNSFSVRFDIEDLDTVMNSGFIYDVPVECDKSNDEIFEACISGKRIVGELWWEGTPWFYFD